MNRSKAAWLAALVAAVVFLAACSQGAQGSQVGQVADSPQSLRVALIDAYLPDASRFRRSIRDAWEDEHPDVDLDFVEWNCFDQDVPDDLDVFVYDAMFLGTFLGQGSLLPLDEGEVEDPDDLVPYAYEACKVDGQLYAVPQLLCTYLLYTREGDTGLDQVKSVTDLHVALGDHDFWDVVETGDAGLLTEEMGRNTKASLYLYAVMDAEGRYSGSFGPAEEEGLTPDATGSLEALGAMGASLDESKQVVDKDNPTEAPHAKLFASGVGRAYFGFSETMNDMGDYAEHVRFRPLSLTSTDNVSVFNADVVSVNAHIDPQKRDLAMDLINVLTRSDVLVSSSLPSDEDPYPQYLFLSRVSAYDALAGEHPIYAKLKEIVSTPGSHVFVLMPDGKECLSNYAAALTEVGLA